MDDLSEFGVLNFGEGFAAIFKLLEGFHGGLGEAVMGGGGAANDGELLAGGEALVAVVVVETYAEEAGFRRATFSIFNHASTVSGSAGVSSGFSFSSRAVMMMSVKASFWVRRSLPRRVSSRTARKVATS